MRKTGSTWLAVMFLLCGTELFAEPYGGGVTYPNTIQVGGSHSFLSGFGISPGTIPPNSGQLLGNTVYYRQFRPTQGGFPASAGFSGDPLFGGGGGGGGGTGGYDYPPDGYPDDGDPPPGGGDPIVPHTPAPGAALLGAIGLGIIGLTRKRTLS